MDLDVDQLASMAVFAHVVEESGFSRAARRLGLSKSAVSKHVARLEERLGARLLNRTTRKISLTDVGATFYERCAAVVREVREAEEAVTRLQESPRGRLRVSAPMSFGTHYVAPVVAAFQAEHPELEVDFSVDDRLVNLIEEGVDLAVRISHLNDSSLVARRLAWTQALICAAPAYLEARGEPARPEDLRDHDCLIYTLTPRPNVWVFETGDGEQSTVRLKGRFRSNNGDALLAAAVAGAGVVLLPDFIAGPRVKSGELHVLFGGRGLSPMPVNAVFPHRHHLSPKVRLLVDRLAESFGPSPPWALD